jgi:hypothetical protein
MSKPPVSSSTPRVPIKALEGQCQECGATHEHCSFCPTVAPSQTPPPAFDVQRWRMFVSDSARRKVELRVAADSLLDEIESLRSRLEEVTRERDYWKLESAAGWKERALAAESSLSLAREELEKVREAVRVYDEQWCVAVQERALAVKELEAARRVIEIAEPFADGLLVGKPYKDLRERLLLAILQYRAASRISSTDNPREAEK